MNDPVQAPQGEPEAHSGEEAPDPLAVTKRVAGRAWPYAAGLVVVLAALGAVFRHQLSWGDFPTWVAATTTLLALLAAAFAGLVAYDVLTVENARDLTAAKDRLDAEKERAAQREADQRAQASKVTAWFTFDKKDQALPTPTWGAAIQNASELPIFDVRVFFYWVNDPHDGRPWTTEQRYASPDRIRVVPPGRFRHYALPDHIRSMAKECNDHIYLVGIEFTDANGRRWFRDERAALDYRGMALRDSAQPQ